MITVKNDFDINFTRLSGKSAVNLIGRVTVNCGFIIIRVALMIVLSIRQTYRIAHFCR